MMTTNGLRKKNRREAITKVASSFTKRQPTTRRERLKSALYLRLKKRKRLFFKNLEIFDFFFKKCRIVPKNVKGGTLWALLTYILLQNNKKTRKGDSFETLNNFQKSRTMPKKNLKGGPFSLVRFYRLR